MKCEQCYSTKVLLDENLIYMCDGCGWAMPWRSGNDLIDTATERIAIQRNQESGWVY